MLRKGFAALMMGVICAGSVSADDTAPGAASSQRSGILTWLRNKPGPQPSSTAVTHAVVEDAERQSAQLPVLQTASTPDNQLTEANDIVAAQDAVPRPIPMEQIPAIPNMDPVSGPQYFSSVNSTDSSSSVPVHPGANWQQYSPPAPVQATSAGQYHPIQTHGLAGPQIVDQGMTTVHLPVAQYPQTGAALYPAPVPGIPYQIGGTLIPNQAFHPHEMLYAHEYRAMYPPYYYKVNGGWMVTPFGVWSHEDWQLQGTMVEVKYKSSISPFTLYKRPARR